MRTRIRTLLPALCLCFFLSSATAHAVEFGIRGSYWYPKLSGHVKLDAEGITGTDISLENELGFGSHSALMGEIFAGIGKHHLSAMYTKLDFEETKILEDDIVFNAVTFHASTELTSQVDWNMFDFKYQYDLLDLENILAGFSLGLVAHVKYLDTKTTLNSEFADTDGSFTAFVPMAGAGLHVGLLADLLEARVVATGIGYSGNSFIEALGELSLTPAPFITISAGYRIIKLNAEYDDQSVDGTFGGPYASVAVAW